MRAESHRARVRVAVHDFHAARGTSAKKREQLVPVERRPIHQLQRERVCRCRGAPHLGRRPAELRGRNAVPSAERIIEPPHARETAREGNLGDGERRLGEQLLGQQQATRERQLHGRHAELALHHASNLPRAPPEALRDRLESPARVEHPFVDAMRHQTRDAVCVVHGGVPRCKLGPAPKARAEVRLLRGFRAVEEAAVRRFGRARRTHRATIDAGGRHAHVEHAIETRVVRGERVVEHRGVREHGSNVCAPPRDS